MSKYVLFIHGGGDDGFKADTRLAASLQKELGDTHKLYYPKMPSNEALPDFGWLEHIGNEMASIHGEVILAGHSLGASMLLKYLSENRIEKKISGIFLIATPLWGGDENWVQGLRLKENFEDKLPKNVPIFLYHSRDDEEVPFEHLSLYIQKLPKATVRAMESGGHQLNNDLSLVAKDISAL